ncbi:MAG: hypothetical protein H7A45_17940 [Verrucomicrobiales bacterium]|nr:hypothetical protein [Verrucomicrobiales bacterium]
MRHLVNVGLLFSFGTLAATGVVAFMRPFSLAATRVHIVFGLVTLILVALHLVARLAYFQARFRPSPSHRVQWPGVAVAWIAWLVIAIQGWEPARLLVEQGYEARRRAAIVRTSPLAGFADPNSHSRLVARAGAEGADASLALTLRFGRDLVGAPSVVVWTETTTGAMIETLYLDDALAYSETPVWGGRPTPRHHIFPLWRHRHTLVSGIDPAGRVDAFTAATPKHSFTLDDYMKLGENRAFVLCVEVNIPNDPNERYPDPHVGQPSLLYTAYIELDAGQPYALLELTGHGGDARESGAIHYDLDGFTSARTLIDLLLARTERQQAAGMRSETTVSGP